MACGSSDCRDGRAPSQALMLLMRMSPARTRPAARLAGGGPARPGRRGKSPAPLGGEVTHADWDDDHLGHVAGQPACDLLHLPPPGLEAFGRLAGPRQDV